MSLATRNTVERALAAFIQKSTVGDIGIPQLGGAFAGDSGNPVPLVLHCLSGKIGPKGEIPEEWGKLKMPALVVASTHSQPHLVGYDICDVQIVAITSPDEVGAPEKVQERIGWLSVLFDEDKLDDVRDALNDPDADVKNLSVVGIERDGEEHAENGRQILGTLKLRVHAAGTG